MTVEKPTYEPDEISAFFNRPADEVAAEFASHWFNHENRSEIHEGQAKILGIRTLTGFTRFFRITEVVLYGDQYTKDRWPNSRSPEIDSLQSGDLITYVSRAATLTFIKTRRSENIQFSSLEEMDRFGDPIRTKESVLIASDVARIAGLGHRDRSKLIPFNFRGERAFLLTLGARELSDEELQRLENEILGETTLSNGELEILEKEILSTSEEGQK